MVNALLFFSLLIARWCNGILCRYQSLAHRGTLNEAVKRNDHYYGIVRFKCWQEKNMMESNRFHVRVHFVNNMRYRRRAMLARINGRRFRVFALSCDGVRKTWNDDLWFLFLYYPIPIRIANQRERNIVSTEASGVYIFSIVYLHFRVKRSVQVATHFSLSFARCEEEVEKKRLSACGAPRYKTQHKHCHTQWTITRNE